MSTMGDSERLERIEGGLEDHWDDRYDGGYTQPVSTPEPIVYGQLPPVERRCTARVPLIVRKGWTSCFGEIVDGRCTRCGRPKR